jgi:hypothetical protein
MASNGTSWTKTVGWLATAGATVGSVALLGCGDLGTRATTGMCPEGETCSPSTPDGLRFYGPSLSGTLDNGAHAIAVGGTQSLRFEDARVLSQPLPAHSSVSSDPSVLEVVSSAQRSVVLRGVASGASLLRVVEPDGRLLDRISIPVRALATVAVARPLLVNDTRPFAFAPGTQRVGFRLLDAGGGALVDEGLVFGTSALTYTVHGWDEVELQLPASGAASMPLTAAGRSFEVPVPIAGPVDDIALNTALVPEEDLDPLTVREGGFLCFDLLSRGATVVGHAETFVFRVDGVAQPAEDGEGLGGCLALPETLGATVTIEVAAAGVTRSFTAQVESSSGMALVDGSPFSLVRRIGSFGDRAARVRGLDLDILSARGI